MKKMRILISLGMLCGLSLLSSCGVYRYWQPTPNPVLFRNAGEVQVAGGVQAGSMYARGGVAITDNIGLMGMYAGGIGDYNCNEGEAGLAFYSGQNSGGILVAGGVGRGKNGGMPVNNTSTEPFEGSYWKPFLQFNAGASNAPLMGSLTGDVVFTTKATYFSYRGTRLNGSNSELSSDYFLVEPAFMLGIGSRVFHMDLSLSYPLHPTFEGLNDATEARTYPMNASFGIRFLLNRKVDD